MICLGLGYVHSGRVGFERRLCGASPCSCQADRRCAGFESRLSLVDMLSSCPARQSAVCLPFLVCNNTAIVFVVSPAHHMHMGTKHSPHVFSSCTRLTIQGSTHTESLKSKNESQPVFDDLVPTLCLALFDPSPNIIRTSCMQMALRGRQRWKRAMLAACAH